MLETAKRTNPDKRIFLLGDEKNRWLGKAKGVEHVLYRDFNYGEQIKRFDASFRHIQGPGHHHIKGGEDWLRFVFKRWFFIRNFLASEHFESFWHFDSDTMIVDALAKHESKFSSYECTEQCNGRCVNGYISGLPFVDRYLDKINRIFEDEPFLKAQQQEINEQRPGWAFTEMSAYEWFKIDEPVNSVPLSTVINGSTFDDCICQEHEMEMERLFNGREIKRIFCSEEGAFFCRNSKTGEVVRMNSLNFSWVPVVLFDVLLAHLKKARDSSEKVDRHCDVDLMPTLDDLSWQTRRLLCFWWKIKNSSRRLRKFKS